MSPLTIKHRHWFPPAWIMLALGALAAASVAAWLYMSGQLGNPDTSPVRQAGRVTVYYPAQFLRATHVYYRPNNIDGRDSLIVSATLPTPNAPVTTGIVLVYTLNKGAWIDPNTLTPVVSPEDAARGAAVYRPVVRVENDEQVVQVATGPVPVSDVRIRASLMRNAIRPDHARTTAVVPSLDLPHECPSGLEAFTEKTCPRSERDLPTLVSVGPTHRVIRIDYTNRNPVAPGEPAWSVQRTGNLPFGYIVSYVDVADEARDSTFVVLSATFVGIATTLSGISMERYISWRRSRRPGPQNKPPPGGRLAPSINGG